ncbi:CidA/LrgA family protein [Domibacillus antri]
MVTALQAGVIYVISAIGNQLAVWLHLSIPGSLAGMLILFGLLMSGVVPAKWVEMGAVKLIAFMPLFLIPATTGIINYGPFFKEEGMGLVLLIIGSTLLTLAVKLNERVSSPVTIPVLTTTVFLICLFLLSGTSHIDYA